MSQYRSIILQQPIKDGELNKLSESDISDLEKRISEVYPLMVLFMKVSLMWPFWSGIKKYGSWVSFVLLIVYFISTFPCAVRVSSDDEFDMNIVMELYIQNFCVFYVIFGMHSVNLDKKVYTTLQEVMVLTTRNLFRCSSEEKKFLQNYIDTSKFASYIITGLLCVSLIMYSMVIPILLPVLANLILPGNHTYQKRFSAHSEFLIDEDTYFYYNFFILSILCFTMVVFISSLSVTYVSITSYVIGKFRFMGFKLKQISYFSRTKDISEKEDKIFKHVSQLVQLHQYCIYCFDLLDTFTSSMLLIGILTVIIGSSISGCVMVIEFKQDINIALKMGFVYIMCNECLFLVSYPSQKIYDASSDIFDSCYFTDWYRYSIKTRKMIKLIMMKSIRPSSFTVGPTKFMNYETTFQIIQLSYSYITTLISFYDRQD